jgi:hypothetical protein
MSGRVCFPLAAAIGLFYPPPCPAGALVPAAATSPRRPSAAITVFAALVSVVAIGGVGAIWAGVSLIVGSNAGWMALVAALDAALLLRLSGYPTSSERAFFAVMITLGTSACAGYLIATARIGMAMGLRPADAIGRMSLELGWLYVESNSGWVELGWLAGACLLAWRLGR